MLPDLSAALPDDVWRRPTTVLVYAHTRRALDPVIVSMALRVSEEPLWIDVREPAAAPPEEEGDASVTALLPHRFELEPAEVLPEQGLANLGAFIAGRAVESPVWVREAEDLTWLPPPIRESLIARERAGRAVSVVVARAERLVMRLPLGMEDVRRLLEILSRRRATVIVGLLLRPLPEFSALFDYVVRVRRGAAGEPEGHQLVLERTPSSASG